MCNIYLSITISYLHYKNKLKHAVYKYVFLLATIMHVSQNAHVNVFFIEDRKYFIFPYVKCLLKKYKIIIMTMLIYT